MNELDASKIKYKIEAFYRGTSVRTEYCDTWLEAETKVSEFFKYPNLYDEMRMVKLGDEDA